MRTDDDDDDNNININIGRPSRSQSAYKSAR